VGAYRDGMAARLWLEVTLTGLTAGTIAADAPFNIFSNIELDDVNNEAILGRSTDTLRF